MKILVTGATGFIGQYVSYFLQQHGNTILATGKESEAALAPHGTQWRTMADLSHGAVDWTHALDGVDAVIHLAGMAHRQDKGAAEDWDGYDRVNHLATRSLAEAIARSTTVTRFIFISSVAVHGTPGSFPLTEKHPLLPDTPYGKSKLDAERAIAETLDPARCKWAIFRPVLVYGPGNPGNMAKLLGFIKRGLPIPIATVPNRRSFLFVGNLADAMLTYMQSPVPPSGRAWIIADSEYPSTAMMAAALAMALGRKPRLWKFPPCFLKGMAHIGDLFLSCGIPSPWNSAIYYKFMGYFFVETNAIKTELNWAPPHSFQEGIQLLFKID